MSEPGYYRRQADICLALSLLAEDPVTAMELIAKAEEFLAKARLADRVHHDFAAPRHVAERDDSEGDQTLRPGLPFA